MTIVLIALIGVVAMNGSKILETTKPWMSFPPFLVYLAVATVTVPFAQSVAYAKGTVQILYIYYFVILATLLLIRTPRLAVPIILLFPFQYVWWAAHARQSGLVKWHSMYGNFDSFGPLCVMGMGICFYFAMATQSKRLRWLFLLLAAYCVVGVVSSFARGAVLAAGLVAFIIWLRSPKKVSTGIAIGIAIAILAVSSSIMHGGSEFWAEIGSSFTEGTQEGTGKDRWELWKTAFRVFKANPIFGVGARNFGPYASAHFDFGEVYGYSSLGELYDRNLHSIYAQTLCEFGLAGVLAFLWVLFDFRKKNQALRSHEFAATWKASTGGSLDLRYISLALEMAMIAYLATGFFYAQLYNHWFYTLLGVNLLLYGTLSTAQPGIPTRARRRPSSLHRRGS